MAGLDKVLKNIDKWERSTRSDLFAAAVIASDMVRDYARGKENPPWYDETENTRLSMSASVVGNKKKVTEGKYTPKPYDPAWEPSFGITEEDYATYRSKLQKINKISNDPNEIIIVLTSFMEHGGADRWKEYIPEVMGDKANKIFDIIVGYMKNDDSLTDAINVFGSSRYSQGNAADYW